ncbi:MAG TPA: aromatic ring-hydroxylating dioxygenase subunit alpha [Rhizomicrobium sp.]|jgi:5,5'-dehydrodivanillate O-demethylase|nr:aromatic ring-hydroxylating dioxygenase subunit alpha [Rhizomicrobium sp.]
MITQQTNERLTRVGPGTDAGALLRMYWHPVAAIQELEEHPTKAIRLMGEDLVLYRDLGGRYGLLERYCPHRRADLSYGFVEETGLRCNYHGWLFGGDGACLAQPFEDVANPKGRYRDKIRQRAYRVEAKAGMLWAYMGPESAPLLPDWEPFGYSNGFAQIVFAQVPCNWLQCQENSIDPVHFEWMHANWKIRLEGQTGYSPTHTRLAFDEFDYGFIYRRIREDTDETDPLWTQGRVCLWPNAFFLGSHIEWRVPIDDENTLSVTWAFRRAPKEREPYAQNSVPYWYGPLKDESGQWITSHVMNQDFLAWVGQGRIADRTRENLGLSDTGVVKFRNRLLTEMDAVAAGRDPKGLIRDPLKNKSVQLPMLNRADLIEGFTLQQLSADPTLKRIHTRYHLQYGQPESVRHAYEEAMGFALNTGGFVESVEA